MDRSRQEREARLAEIRQAQERRLHQLQVQQAQQGSETPPHIVNEIEDLERKLAEVQVAQQVVNGGAISSPAVLGILRELAPNELLVKTQMMQQLAIDEIKKDLAQMRGEQGESKAQRAALAEGVRGLRMDVRVAGFALLALILVVGCSAWGMLIYLFQR